MKLEDFKVFELKDLIRKYNKHVKIAGFSSMKKSELISALRNHPRLEIKEGEEKIQINIKPLKDIGKNIKNVDKKPKKKKAVKKDSEKVSQPVEKEGGGKPTPKSAADKRADRLAFMRKKKAEKKEQLPGTKLKKVTKEDIEDLGKEKPKKPAKKIKINKKPLMPKIKEIMNKYYQKLFIVENDVLKGKLVDESKEYNDLTEKYEEQAEEKLYELFIHNFFYFWH